ncbi:hypothetical protein [Paenibacillus montanisoli]|uniref:Uncharacterized protein n=1 Tax=Paenibacillus montanisoli TaxID=2081970 RepID=A0A328U7D5_9BACL|nr:hypothetical protein [Paenibacillus montanisoli]RAP75936.1 hypothetical protein DL346_10925 [Paenibacillus montanisoli]
MLLSAKQLLTELIDYAGLFPPAELPMEDAIRQFARYARDQDQWMLGKFVVPVSRLDELEPHIGLFSQAQPLHLSAIGYRCRSSAECLELLNGSLARIRSFHADAQDAAVIDTLDLPVPPIPVQGQLLTAVGAETAGAGLRTFCEFTYALDSHWESNMLEAIHQLAIYNAASEAKLGLKLRTGGLSAEAFPAPEQVALVLQACRDSAVSLKFTAGLHHPIRMHRTEVSAKMHGFLNVFIAGLLAHAHGLDRKRITEIVEDEDPNHFRFTDDGLEWNAFSIPTAEIQRYREKALTVYGSCSFDEPRDELRELYKLERRS